MSTYHPSMPSIVGPLPAPQPKAVYSAPVFRTFQDRRREREMERRGSIDHQTPMNPGPPQWTPRPVQIAQPSHPAEAGTSISPTGSSTFPSSPRFHDHPKYSIAPSTDASLRHSRPLPAPIPSSPSSSTPSIGTSLSRTPSPSAGRDINIASEQYVSAELTRSDTVSSVKSVDRIGFTSSRRPLPRTPVVVNSSRSLDRGLPIRAELVSSSRKQPSIVHEEDDGLDFPAASSSSPYRMDPPVVVVPTIGIAPSNESSPSGITEIPAERDTRIPDIAQVPAKYSSLPTLSLPTDEYDEDEPGTGIALSGLPTINVSSEDTAINFHVSTSNNSIVCAECNEPIVGRIVNAMGRRFHPQCFNCKECGTPLEHVSSYEWAGKAYCHLDYHDVSCTELNMAHDQKFAHHCYYCKTAIVDDRFITLNDSTLGERYYHELHFFCSECGDPFLDPSKSSAPGTKLSSLDEEGETNPFVIHRGHPYCEGCHLRLHKPKCKACKKPIPDVAVDALGAKWHKECFTCSVSKLSELIAGAVSNVQHCRNEFANGRFFPNDGQPLCITCWESTL